MRPRRIQGPPTILVPKGNSKFLVRGNYDERAWRALRQVTPSIFPGSKYTARLIPTVYKRPSRPLSHVQSSITRHCVLELIRSWQVPVVLSHSSPLSSYTAFSTKNRCRRRVHYYRLIFDIPLLCSNFPQTPPIMQSRPQNIGILATEIYFPSQVRLAFLLAAFCRCNQQSLF